MNNQPFRDNGKLLFRPGGHGALIENLNDLDADIIFIKNIDNVVPDKLKGDTVLYKKLIAGVLVVLQQKAFAYLELLDSGTNKCLKFCNSCKRNCSVKILRPRIWKMLNSYFI